jgi:hypothetical protein
LGDSDADHARLVAALEERWINRLRAMRGPGESYSDVIIPARSGARPSR